MTIPPLVKVLAQSNAVSLETDQKLVNIPLLADSTGALFVSLVGGGGQSGGGLGSITMDSDANFSEFTNGLPTASGMYGYSDAAAGWIRVRTLTPSDVLANPALDDSLSATSFNMAYSDNLAKWIRIRALTPTDALRNPSFDSALSEVSFNMVYSGGASWNRTRGANVFKTVIASASGSTAVWTPTAGKSFNLMGYTLSASGTTGSAGTTTVQLTDGATVIKNHLISFASGTAVGDTQIGVSLGSLGQLSAAVNNVLNINLSGPITSGGVAVNVWGTEE